MLLQITNYILQPLENVKKNAILFKLFWYKGFVYWKLKLLNFQMDSALINYFCVILHIYLGTLQILPESFLFTDTPCWALY